MLPAAPPTGRSREGLAGRWAELEHEGLVARDRQEAFCRLEAELQAREDREQRRAHRLVRLHQAHLCCGEFDSHDYCAPGRRVAVRVARTLLVLEPGALRLPLPRIATVCALGTTQAHPLASDARRWLREWQSLQAGLGPAARRGLSQLTWRELGAYLLARHAHYLRGRAGWPALGLTLHARRGGVPLPEPDPVVERAWLALERAMQSAPPRTAVPDVVAAADAAARGEAISRWATASFRRMLEAERERCLRDAASLGDESYLWQEYQRLGALPPDVWRQWVAPVTRRAWEALPDPALRALCLQLRERRWWAGVRELFASFAPPPPGAAGSESPFEGQGWPQPGAAEPAVGPPPIPRAWHLAWGGLEAACGSAATVAEALRWLQDADERQDPLAVPRWDGSQRGARASGGAGVGLPPLVELLGSLLQHALPELRDLADPNVQDSDYLLTLSLAQLGQQRRAEVARARAVRLRRACVTYRQLEAGASLLCPGSDAQASLRALAGSTLAESFRLDAGEGAAGTTEDAPGASWPAPLLQARHALLFNFLLLSLLWGAGELWAHGPTAEGRLSGTLAAAWGRIVSRFQSLCAARVRLLSALPEVRGWQAECETAYRSLCAVTQQLPRALAAEAGHTPPRAVPRSPLLPAGGAAADTDALQWLAHSAVLPARVDAYLGDVASEWRELRCFVHSRWGWELPSSLSEEAAGVAAGPRLGTASQLCARLTAAYRRAQFIDDLRGLLVHWPAVGSLL